MYKSLTELSGSIVQCITACLQSQPVCIGFKYEENNICKLLDNVIPETLSKENEEMWVSETWITGN